MTFLFNRVSSTKMPPTTLPHDLCFSDAEAGILGEVGEATTQTEELPMRFQCYITSLSSMAVQQTKLACSSFTSFFGLVYYFLPRLVHTCLSTLSVGSLR